MTIFGRKVDKMHSGQLELIGYVDRKVAESMVTGGWAVEGIHQASTAFTDILRVHDNVDFMVAEKYTRDINRALDDFDMDRYQEPGENIRAHREDGLKADIVILYPITKKKKKFWKYKTPYHDNEFEIPTCLLESAKVKVGNTKFRALKATQLYLAKIFTKHKMVDTDLFDTSVLGPYVDPETLKKLMPYTGI